MSHWKIFEVKIFLSGCEWQNQTCGKLKYTIVLHCGTIKQQYTYLSQNLSWELNFNMKIFQSMITLHQTMPFIKWEGQLYEGGVSTSLVRVFTNLFWCGRVGGYHLNIPPESDWVATVRNSCSPHHIHILGEEGGERKCNSWWKEGRREWSHK